MTTHDSIVQRDVSGVTLADLLRRNAREYGDLPALTSGIDPDALTLTWREMRNEVAALTHGLQQLGLLPGERMMMMMSRRPEHWICDLASAHLGSVSCTAYDTLSTDDIRFVATHSGATLLVLEGAEQLSRWAPVLDDLPRVRRIVVVDADVLPVGDDRFVSYQSIREAGGAAYRADPDSFEELSRQVDPHAPMCMIYTSGTTGDPKGVVLSNSNVVHAAALVYNVMPLGPNPRSIAHLPLAHIGERLQGIYRPLYSVGHVTICPHPSELMRALIVVHPAMFAAPPRVWEKIIALMDLHASELPADEAATLESAKSIASEVYRIRAAGGAVPNDLADRFDSVAEPVLRQIREKVGLDHLQRSMIGTAPTPDWVVESLAAFGINVREAYGMSESSGVAAVSTLDQFAIGAVGIVTPGLELKLAEDGEIMVRGPVVFLGYLQADGSIKPDVDVDGWLGTGDLGRVDDRGLYYIVGRKKEIIITSGGKNIAPVKIESRLKAHPLIGQAAAIGDRRKFVSALLVLDEEAAPRWAVEHGIETTELAALSAHPAVLAELDRHVAEVNATLAQVEGVKKYHVLIDQWSSETGELTATTKMRRSIILDKYATEIDRLYAESAQ